MDMGWLAFEFGISFLEMLTSSFFAARVFRKRLENIKDLTFLILFSACGAMLLTLRELAILPIPDFVPAILIFSMYAILICHVKAWMAVFWALLNYLLIGIASILTNSILGLVLNAPLEQMEIRANMRILKRVTTRILQLLMSEIILHIMGGFRHSDTFYKGKLRSIGIFAFSILILTVLWKVEFNLTEEVLLYFNIFICSLILLLNFTVLFFSEVILKERRDKEELAIQNQIVSMQVCNQNEINAIYYDMRALKHDMNAHLHTISGYLQMAEYKKADDYIQNIIGEVSKIETYQSGNRTLDALIGSKSALARKHGIRIQIDMVVSQELKISDEHLVAIIGNLYDNSIDACLKVSDPERRYIKIQILTKNYNLILLFENSAIQESNKRGGVWYTTKKDRLLHGFGLKNIDRIIQMYDGYCEREQTKDVFICRIRIPNACVNSNQ